MDLGYVLAWMIGLGSGLALIRLLRSGPSLARGWIIAHALALFILAVFGWLTSIERAGQIAAVFWVPGILLPLLLGRLLMTLLVRHRFGPARLIAHVVRWLHPADGWQYQIHMVDALAALDAGEFAQAAFATERIPAELPLRRSVEARGYQARGDLEGATRWLDQIKTYRPDQLAEPGVAVLNLRVAGELGDTAYLVAALERFLRSSAATAERATAWLTAASLGGEPSLTHSVIEEAFPTIPDDAAQYWRLTARQRAGEDVSKEFFQLTRSATPSTRKAALRRMETPLAPLADAHLLVPLFARLHRELGSGALRTYVSTKPRMTYALSGLLVLAFAVEIPGGVEDLENLIELGALVVPTSLLPGEPWRVFTAGLLHFGWTHLILNTLALFYFGRYVENHLGRLWLALSFAVSSVGAMQLVVLTSQASEINPGVVVGASGGVMGVLGAMLASVAVRYWSHRPPQLRRQLASLVLIIALQTVFDAVTPQVSGPVHIYGLLIGFAIGWLATRMGKVAVVDSAL